MEYLTFDTALTLFVVSLAAGLVDSIAGGGGLLALPALLWAGLPPLLALGTNKLQGSFGTLAASIGFWRQGLVDPRRMGPAIACTFVGAVGGTIAVQTLSADLLQTLVPVLLIGFALYFLFSPRVSDRDAAGRMGPLAFALLIAPLVGAYDGFFGPGTGSFFMLAYVALLGYNLRRATAHTKVLNFTSNVASLLAFALAGNLVWSLGLVMALGQFSGAWVGSHLAVRHGSRIIRPALVLVSLLVSGKLLLQWHF
jgi:uncharacterized membrane protein YfcA